jgi:hypothetical protein
MRTMHLVVYQSGSSWLPGQPIAEQPLRDHGPYMLSLYVKRSLRFAGRFSDDAGGAAAFEGTDAERGWLWPPIPR